MKNLAHPGRPGYIRHAEGSKGEIEWFPKDIVSKHREKICFQQDGTQPGDLPLLDKDFIGYGGTVCGASCGQCKWNKFDYNFPMEFGRHCCYDPGNPVCQNCNRYGTCS